MAWPSTRLDTFLPNGTAWNELVTALQQDQGDRNGANNTYSNINIAAKTLKVLTDAAGSPAYCEFGRVTTEARVAVAASGNQYLTGSAAGDLVIQSASQRVLIGSGSTAVITLAASGVTLNRASLTAATFGQPTLHMPNAQSYAVLGDEGVLQSWPSYGLSGARLAYNLVHEGTVGDKTITANASSAVVVGRGVINFYTQSSAAAGAIVPMVERLRVDTTGVTAISTLRIQGAASSDRRLDFYTGAASNPANLRWLWYANSVAETGSNAGSNFGLNRYSDAGAYLGTAILVDRASGLVTIADGLSVNATVSSVHAFGTVRIMETTAAGWRWTLNNDSTLRLQRTTNNFSSAVTPLIFNAADNIQIERPTIWNHLITTASYANDAAAAAAGVAVGQIYRNGSVMQVRIS